MDKHCQSLRAAGLAVIRDKDEVKHGQSLLEFMRDLGASNFLCVFLSDGYLRSPNCMYELLVAWQRSKDNPEEFRSRVKVWVMPGAGAIRKPEGRIAYLEHWLAEKKRVEPLIKKFANKGLASAELEGFRRIKQFAEHVNEILCFFADTFSPESAEDFEKWIAAQFPARAAAATASTPQRPGSTVPAVAEPPPAARRDPQNEYPKTVNTVNDLLRRNPEVASFFREHGADFFGGTSPHVQLNSAVGMQRMDLVSVVDPLVAALRVLPRAGAEFVKTVEIIIGGLLVLGVDPDWVAAQRALAAAKVLQYFGDDFHKTEGEVTVHFLELIIHALGDSACRFDDVFRSKEERDFRDIPAHPLVMKGVLAKDRGTEVKRCLIKHIKQRDPLPQDVEKLFSEVRESMADARNKFGKPYYSTDPGFSEHVELIKKDLALVDLFLILPAGGSESEMVQKAHLLVPRLHELFAEIKRLKAAT